MRQQEYLTSARWLWFFSLAHVFLPCLWAKWVRASGKEARDSTGHLSGPWSLKFCKAKILKRWFRRCLSALFWCDFEQVNSSSPLCSSFLAWLKGQPPDDSCALGCRTGRRLRRNGGDWTLSREWLWTKAHMRSQSPTEHASLLKGICSQNLSGPLCPLSQEAAYLVWMSGQLTSKGPSL